MNINDANQLCQHLFVGQFQGEQEKHPVNGKKRKRPNSVKNTLNTKQGTPVSTSEMKQVQELVRICPCIQNSIECIIDQVVEGGVTIQHHSERNNVRKVVVVAFEWHWNRFARNIVRHWLTFGFCIVSKRVDDILGWCPYVIEPPTVILDRSYSPREGWVYKVLEPTVQNTEEDTPCIDALVLVRQPPSLAGYLNSPVASLLNGYEFKMQQMKVWDYDIKTPDSRCLFVQKCVPKDDNNDINAISSIFGNPSNVGEDAASTQEFDNYSTHDQWSKENKKKLPKLKVSYNQDIGIRTVMVSDNHKVMVPSGGAALFNHRQRLKLDDIERRWIQSVEMVFGRTGLVSNLHNALRRALNNYLFYIYNEANNVLKSASGCVEALTSKEEGTTNDWVGLGTLKVEFIK